MRHMRRRNGAIHRIGGQGSHGQWLIDPAELHRVYEPVAVNVARNVARNVNVIPQEMDALSVEVRMLREMVADQRTMIEGLENVISDLMARLDRESEDRRRAYAQFTGLLTDQRSRKWQLWMNNQTVSYPKKISASM